MIHVITGPPCSGKSTYVEEHAMPGELQIDFDKIAKTFGAAQDHQAKGLAREAAIKARKCAVEIAIKNPAAESWIISTEISAGQRKAYEEAGAEIVVLNPGMKECLERAERDGRPAETAAEIEEWYKRHEKGANMKFKNAKLTEITMGGGSISGFFSSYDREPDWYGDIVAPGAFTNTIKKRRESGHPFPLCWNHDTNAIIGVVDMDSFDDRPEGPWMTAIFLNTALAQEKRELCLSGIVYQFSFAYDVIKSARVKLENGMEANELQEVELYEISVVPIPAKQAAVATDVKAGRRNSKADADKITQAITLLREVLGELDDTDDDDNGEDGKQANSGKEEEPKGGNPEEKTRLLERMKHILEKE